MYVAIQQRDGSFGSVSNVTALNSPLFEARSTISRDGLEIFFLSNRATGSPAGQQDLWTATRASTAAVWSTPTSLTALNTHRGRLHALSFGEPPNALFRVGTRRRPRGWRHLGIDAHQGFGKALTRKGAATCVAALPLIPGNP
jgi:hypothetical protein